VYEVMASSYCAVTTATYRVAVGVNTAGIRWSAATTATQQLAVLTHLPRAEELVAVVLEGLAVLVGRARHAHLHCKPRASARPRTAQRLSTPWLAVPSAETGGSPSRAR
jgi:hypothetical protein